MDAEAIVLTELRRLAGLTDRELYALYALRARDLGLTPMRRHRWKRLSGDARRHLTLVAVDGLGAPLDRRVSPKRSHGPLS